MGVLMQVSDALTLSQLQTLRQILQQMEADGVRSLPDARRLINAAEQRRHAERISMGRKGTAKHKKAMVGQCPGCGGDLSLILVDGAAIKGCKKCRWSALVEG